MQSNYLHNVFETALPDLGENIVLYGWSMSKEDDHIIEQLSKNTSIKRIAVSIHNNQIWDSKKKERITSRFSAEIEWCFYDAESPGCWIY